jgi:hypothetical protein
MSGNDLISGNLGPGRAIAALLLVWTTSCGAQVSDTDDDPADQPAAPSSPTGSDGGAAPDQRSAPADAGAAPDAAPAQAKVSQALDMNVLHQVVVEAAPDVWTKIVSAPRLDEARFPVDITYDGVKTPMAAVRMKGNYGSRYAAKPGLSIKFDEFVPNQKLGGLTHLNLENAKQDDTFLRIHLVNEIYRTANMAAALSAHAMVTLKITGQAPKLLGLYVVNESESKDFFKRSFGDGSGNAYSGNIVDWVAQPKPSMWLVLKNQVEEMRTPDDLIKLAGLIKNTPDDAWVKTVSTAMDLDQFITSFAIDAIVGMWDDYFYGMNNFVLYDNPKDNRFVYIPHCYDSVFCKPGSWPQPPSYCTLDPMVDPFIDPLVPATAQMFFNNRVGLLTKRIRTIPAVFQKWKSEVGRVIRQAWDVPKLQARIDLAEKVITSSTVSHADIDRFKANLPAIRDYIVKRKAYVESITQ